MRKTGAALVLLLLACAGARPAAAWVVDSRPLLYAEENGFGYRTLTSVEPAAGVTVPLSNITIYPESDQVAGLELSYREDDVRGTSGRSSTLILRTNILLQP